MPTPPPEFDPLAWCDSLQRVLDARPSCLWLTHGGCAARGAEHAAGFLQRAMERVRQQAEWLRMLVSNHADDAQAVAAYRELELPLARAAGVSAARIDIFLDEAFFRMNLAGARRAFAQPR